MNSIFSSLQVSDQQFTYALDQLKEFVAIPSVSNPQSPCYSMETLSEAAQFVHTKLEDLGFSVQQVRVGGSAPYVIAEKIVDIAKPTLLLYAHYDVQPVDKDKWDTDPFVVTERDGRLYGRGASDDKAGLIAIITALRVYEENERELPVNIKVLSEGEEEYGSTHMGTLLQEQAEKLQAEALVILDGSNRDVDTGTLTCSTRGVVNLSLKVKALRQPVHSGLGLLAPDPAAALAMLITSLYPPKEIPGFKVIPELSKGEREVYRESSIRPDSYKEEMGVLPGGELRGIPNCSVYERIAETPSISIVNMTAGQPGGGNSIQDEASCTIGIRVTAGQDPEETANAVKTHLENQPTLWNLSKEVEVLEASHGWKGDVTGPFSSTYLETLGKNFKHKCVVPCGGALPLLHEFKHVFPKMEMIIPGIEDPQTNAHSHNESQSIDLLRNTINTMISFMEKTAEIPVE